MNSTRINMLREFIAEDPNDPFNHYALALELMQSDKTEAKKIFEQLIHLHPDYVPSYYQAATLFLELSLKNEAVKIIEQGIIKAKEQNERKAINELRSLLDELS